MPGCNDRWRREKKKKKKKGMTSALQIGLYVTVVVLMTESTALLGEFITAVMYTSDASDLTLILTAMSIALLLITILSVSIDWLDSVYSQTEGSSLIVLFTRSTLVSVSLPNITIGLPAAHIVLLIAVAQILQAFYSFGHALAFKDVIEEERTLVVFASIFGWLISLLMASFISYSLLPRPTDRADRKSKSTDSAWDRTQKYSDIRVVGVRHGG